MGLVYFASEQPRQIWRWAGYGLSAISLLYVHYLGLHVIFAQAIFLALTLYKDRGALLRAGLTLSLVGAAFVPWLGHFLRQASNGPAFYLTNQSLGQLVDTFARFSSWLVPSFSHYL